jgi:hypothetical protein
VTGNSMAATSRHCLWHYAVLVHSQIAAREGQ